MGAFVAHVDGAYALQVPPALTISLRGLHLMLRDFTQQYDQPPTNVLMTQRMFNRLCGEAARDHKTFADEANATAPRFEGIPIAFIDADYMDNIIF